MTELGGDDGVYLDDLRMGQRFTSKTHPRSNHLLANWILSPFT